MDVESKGADRHSGRLSTLHKTGPPVRDDATPVYPAERKEKVLARDRRVKLKLRAATNGRTGMRLEFEFRKNSCFLNGTANHMAVSPRSQSQSGCLNTREPSHR